MDARGGCGHLTRTGWRNQREGEKITLVDSLSFPIAKSGLMDTREQRLSARHSLALALIHLAWLLPVLASAAYHI